MADKRLILCPYCGNTQNEPEDRCGACGGFFDGLSLKVTQEHMGPWFIRDRHNPFRPGMSYDVVKREAEKGRIKATTIIKGPTTRQFWSVARNIPGIAHLVGYCHACGAHVKADDDNCSECGEVFFSPKIRDNLGLAPMGTEVQAKSKLSDSGAYEAVQTAKPGEPAKPAATDDATPATGAAAAAAAGLTLPGTTPAAPPPPAAPAPPPPTTDQPVGSSILAGLRSDEPAAGGTATVGTAASQSNSSRDAMAWMTPGANQEADTLQTAGDSTAPLPKASNPMTWVLISVNVLLLVVIAAVAIYLVTREKDNDPDPTPPPSDVSTVPDNQTDDPSSDPTDGDNDVLLADPTDSGFDDDPADDTPPAPPEPADDDEALRTQLAEQFQTAIAQERDGDLNDALMKLKQIASQPQDVQPDGVGAAIRRVERKIRRAELDDIF